MEYHLQTGRRTPAALLLGAVVAVALIVQLLAVAAVDASEHDGSGADWEVWALDQGTDINRIHVYQLQDGDFVEVESISFAELDEPHNAVQTPHMIDFDDSNRYAVVASTASGTVSIIRTSDYEVIETFETGATAHMASFAPAPDNSIWVANIGSKTFTQITADLENEQFEIGQDIPLVENLKDGDWPGWNETYGDELEDWPGVVCHDYTADGQHAYVTLGPMAGGLVVVDLSTGEIAQAFDPRDVQANCGLALSANHQQIYANWSGDLANLDNHDDAEPGEWYVFDVNTHELIETHSSVGSETAGIDPHGTRVSPDGTELWQVNRVSNDGIVVDTATNEIIGEFQLTDTPDILDFSPDGEWVFVTLRGPNPASMPHVAEGQSPGVEVFNVETRESYAVLQPANDDELDASDFHGVAVRGPVDQADETDDAPAATADDATDDASGDDATETDDTEDLLPATGGDTGSVILISVFLLMLAAGLVGTATLVHFRARQE